MRISYIPCCGRCARGVLGCGPRAWCLRRSSPQRWEVLALLEGLEHLAIEDELPANIAERLWSLVSSLGIVENNVKIVASTKALHHLLPDLIVPMDREYTGKFFQFTCPNRRIRAVRAGSSSLPMRNSPSSRSRHAQGST